MATSLFINTIVPFLDSYAIELKNAATLLSNYLSKFNFLLFFTNDIEFFWAVNSIQI